MTDQERYERLLKITPEIEHEGRKQWPNNYRYKFLNRNSRISDIRFNFPAKNLVKCPILEAMQIIKDFETSERKDKFTCKHEMIDFDSFCICYYETPVHIKQVYFPYRTENPNGNLVKCDCPVCENAGCSLCW